MKNMVISPFAAIIAVFCVGLVNANPAIDIPTCGSGRFLYYYLGSSNTDIDELTNVNNYSLAADDEQIPCDGVTKLCSICAYSNPNDSSLPLIDPAQASSGQISHTTILHNKIQDYAVNQTSGNDQLLQVLYEH